MVLQISWKNCPGRQCLCSWIRLQHAILTQYEGAWLPHMALLAYCCITDRCVCVCAWTVLMHKPAAAGGMWRGSQARRNDLLHERLVISCWEDRIWHLFNLGKVAVCVCLHVCVCLCVFVSVCYPLQAMQTVHMCMHNNVSYITARHNNSPLVVSPCTCGGTCAAGVAAQFIIYMFPLSADCDLERWVRIQSDQTKRQKK